MKTKSYIHAVSWTAKGSNFNDEMCKKIIIGFY